ncbi:FAD-dependent monooxygenase [Cyanobium sp. CH-040]|uniref:FAD-dependent monooxygenase n=1 Tax=Cyanobium sp. CH-040 TaxID=2823708 RepID=UPI0020CF83A6|nr:FAD-dependent monooxygenase [Cyanobium sp. CH-040]
MGAGPAGATLALRLSRAGRPVTLVEASTSLERQFRGEALMPHGLEALEAMGLLPLAGAIPQRPLCGWSFVLEGRELFRLAEPLEAGPDAAACTLISQPELLRHWLAELGELPGARLLLGRRAAGLLLENGRVAGVRLDDGQTLTASLVVAADGRASRLRQQAGLPLQRRGDAIELLWFRLEGHDPSPLQGWFTTLIGPGGLFSAFDSASGGVQLGWVPQGEETSGDWAERFAALSPPALAAWLRDAAADLREPVRLRVEVGQVERWWRPGLLLLGDAAHPMSPVRAQGINLALRDACTAAEELLKALEGCGGEEQERRLDRALARIEARRRPECERIQTLQAEETQRGLLLRRQGWLRRALALNAPWLGALVAERWRRQQLPLRLGVTNLHGDGTTPAAAAAAAAARR